MTWQHALAKRTEGFALPPWDELPDLGLYMDQVITFLMRVHQPLFGEDKRIITPAMINNYVKSGLITRPEKKKYSREQMAQLIIVCGLKQTMTLDDMKLLLTEAEPSGIIEIYERFCAQQQAAASRLAGISDDLDPMQCAVMSAAYRLLCETMLHMETPDDEAEM